MPFGTTRIWAKNSAEVIGLLIAVPGAKILGEVPLETMVPGQWVLRLMVMDPLGCWCVHPSLRNSLQEALPEESWDLGMRQLTWIAGSAFLQPRVLQACPAWPWTLPGVGQPQLLLRKPRQSSLTASSENCHSKSPHQQIPRCCAPS